MNKELEQLSNYVQEYKSVSLSTADGHKLNRLLKDISTTVYYLQGERVKYKDMHEDRLFELVNREGYNVNRAENICNKEIPELHKLTTILKEATRVSDAIRTNISYLKHEIQMEGFGY